MFLGIQHAGEEIEEAPDAPLHDPLAHCSNITQLFQQNFTVSEFVQIVPSNESVEGCKLVLIACIKYLKTLSR